MIVLAFFGWLSFWWVSDPCGYALHKWIVGSDQTTAEYKNIEKACDVH